MHAVDELDDLERSLIDAFRQAILRAYEHGREAGSREAKEVIKLQLVGLLEDGEKPTTAPVVTSAAGNAGAHSHVNGMTAGARAVPGSIKPAILEALDLYGQARISDIVAATKIKENTVRGTLRNLLQEGKVEKINGMWIKPKEYREKQDPDAEASG